MKIQATRRVSGFTLIELLVVIAIIAVLAAAGFAAGNAAIQKAKRVTALSSATGLETAVSNFHTEYGGMPTDSNSDTETVNTKEGKGVELVRVLLGMETTNSPLNTRGVKFLTVKEGKGNKGGLIYSTNGSDVTGLFDPWGGGFNVAMDCNYDEQIKVKGGVTLRRKVAVWSDGADVASGGSDKTGDDVKTW